ncbi:MAG: hypothetical protein GX592_04910 [Clostridiales bacterium]|nr:hypothetical protein [Clostridiales bacterium]
MTGTGGLWCPKCGLLFPTEDGPTCQLCGTDMIPQALSNHWGGVHTPEPSIFYGTVGQMLSGKYDMFGRPYKAKPRSRKRGR